MLKNVASTAKILKYDLNLIKTKFRVNLEGQGKGSTGVNWLYGVERITGLLFFSNINLIELMLIEIDD